MKQLMEKRRISKIIEVSKDLVSCLGYHQSHVQEPLVMLEALKFNPKDRKELRKLQQSIRAEHLRYAKAIRLILSEE